jgi:hypothetical protein
MKHVVFTLLTLLFIRTPLIAEQENFESHKAEVLKNIDERMTKLVEHKACVSAATDPQAMKACRDKMKDWMKAEREERKSHHKNKMHDKKD